MSKTISTRISNDIHERLVNKCNTLGCNMSDFIKDRIELALADRSDNNQHDIPQITQESDKARNNIKDHDIITSGRTIKAIDDSKSSESPIRVRIKI